MKGTLITDLDNTRALGSSSNRWTEVWAVDGSINTSDVRDKTNIEDLNYGLNEIMKLHPVTFSWISRPEAGTKIGLIAQELQQVLPEVVRDYDWQQDENSTVRVNVPSVRLGVMYDDIIPVLVKAMQELSEKNDQLAMTNDQLISQNKKLEERVSALELQSAIENPKSEMTDGFAKLQTSDFKPQTILGQNIPNPFDNSTLIPFLIPKDCNSAYIMITESATSRVVVVIPITCNETHLQIDAGKLSGGTYSYSLYVDGILIQTKQMAIVR